MTETIIHGVVYGTEMLPIPNGNTKLYPYFTGWGLDFMKLLLSNSGQLATLPKSNIYIDISSGDLQLQSPNGIVTLPVAQYFLVVNGTRVNYIFNQWQQGGLTTLKLMGTLTPGTELSPLIIAGAEAEAYGAKLQKTYGSSAIWDKSKQAVNNAKNAAHDLVTNPSKALNDAKNSIQNAIGNNLGGGKAIHALNKYNPYFIAIRVALLSMIELNVVNLGYALSLVKSKAKNTQWADIQQKWWMWGGEKNSLDLSVDKGKDKPGLFSNLLPENLQITRNADGNASPGKIVSIAAASLGVLSWVLTKIPEPTPTSKIVASYTATGATALQSLGPILKQFSEEHGGSDYANKIPSGPDPAPAPIPTNPTQAVATNNEIVSDVPAPPPESSVLPKTPINNASPTNYSGGKILLGYTVLFLAVVGIVYKISK